MLENSQDTTWQISDQFRSMYEQYTLCGWRIHFDSIGLIYGPIHQQHDDFLREVNRSSQSH